MKREQELIILGELPDLNTYIQAERGNKFAAAKIKKEATELVAWEAKAQKLKPTSSSSIIEFEWYCKNRKKDPDNVAFARKFCLDGLKLAGILKDDGWNYIEHFEDWFFIDEKNQKIRISIISYEE